MRRSLPPIALAPIAVVTVLLAGCGSAAAPPQAATAPAEVLPVAAASSITDVRGRTITVDAPPERVVCLVSLCEDVLLELGMRPVARTGELLEQPAFLGPAAAAEIPKVPGGFGDPDVETIVALEPDLVIGLLGVHDTLEASLASAAPVWLTDSASIEDSIRYLRDLGALTGRGEQAVAAETAFRAKLADAAATADRDTTALVVFGQDGTFEIGTGSYLGELLSTIYDYPWQQTGQFVGSSPYSVEEIAAAGADVIFAMDYNSDDAAPSFASTLAQDPLWLQVAAVQTGAVHEVSPDLWGNGRGTRSLGAVLDEARALTGP